MTDSHAHGHVAAAFRASIKHRERLLHSHPQCKFPDMDLVVVFLLYRNMSKFLCDWTCVLALRVF